MAAPTPKTSHIDIWIALRRLDLNDEEVPIVKDVCIARGLDTTATKQLRDSRGSLVPMNGELNVNSKQLPYILEVTKLFQHVVPKTRTDVMTVINKGLKNRLQSIMKRIERIEELAPEVKMRRQDKLNEEIELLNQKLRFLNQRMETGLQTQSMTRAVRQWLERLQNRTVGKACLNVNHYGEFSSSSG
ncbi:uncharacterized protein si:zfos-1056e6.1 isoform X2 [Scyliorhinus canicula]|uniref:uncharacterized protein si:zfos-1056e6.1 isoform X2 n=1 Tax=Scyliorhinus canicula TaxID=7830 RepID=UPI0018F28840|nr:uncharacterized protein si:zfos-1056e6.1 isoform X2 [Scyliorhinus canicula]